MAKKAEAAKKPAAKKTSALSWSTRGETKGKHQSVKVQCASLDSRNIVVKTTTKVGEVSTVVYTLECN